MSHLYPSATESLLRDVTNCQQRRMVSCCKSKCCWFLTCPIVQAAVVAKQSAGEEGMKLVAPSYERPKRVMLPQEPTHRSGRCHVVVQRSGV